MDTTHSDTFNNNNVLAERESEGRLNLKKRHENDADEVRESYSLYSSTNIFSSHKIFLCCRLCTMIVVEDWDQPVQIALTHTEIVVEDWDQSVLIAFTVTEIVVEDWDQLILIALRLK